MTNATSKPLKQKSSQRLVVLRNKASLAHSLQTPNAESLSKLWVVITIPFWAASQNRPRYVLVNAPAPVLGSVDTTGKMSDAHTKPPWVCCDMYYYGGPQPFWHQALVSWKTIFPQTQGCGGMVSG